MIKNRFQIGFFMNKKKKIGNDNIITLLDFLKWLINKENFIIFTAIIYIIWTIFQLLKIRFISENITDNSFTAFFSFSNTLNDFAFILSYFWLIAVMSIFVSYFVCIFPYILYKSDTNFKWKWKVLFITYNIIFIILIWVFFYDKIKAYEKLLLVFAMVIFLLQRIISLWLVYLLLFKKKFHKKYYYLMFILYFLISFILMVMSSNWTFYACRDNNKDHYNLKNNCVLIKYKNDKYWFINKWTVSKLEEFKIFYTMDQYKKLIWTETQPNIKK